MTNGEQGSVGPVETRTVRLDLPPEGFALERGGSLPALDVAYETYGTLSANRDNAIFICHALSGDAHVAGTHGDDPRSAGWWDQMVGPGKGIDTNFYHVVCANVLGGCKGTTGPSSIHPATGKPYGSAFPRITVGDIVGVHRLLLRALGIERLAAVAGGSFGGMQALEWTIRYPAEIGRCICIASATSLSAQALAFDIVGRTAITYDPDWQRGDYYDSGRSPDRGLALARKVGHITYLSPAIMDQKFGRERRSTEGEPEAAPFQSSFQVESYLEHQGDKFIERFDANSYLHISRAMDEYSLVERFGSLEDAFAPIRAKMMVVALSSDWLFPPAQSRDIANALLRAGKRVTYCLLRAPHGHDAFLVDIEHLAEGVRAFLPWVTKDDNGALAAVEERAEGTARRRPGSNGPVSAGRRREFEIIGDIVNRGSRVLDLGCGNGDLLASLARSLDVSGIGVDIDIQHVIDVIDKGHDVFQGDIDDGLAMIPDRSYDYAVLSETLPMVRKPRFVLREMLRVAEVGIVSFPNFGNLSHRLYLWLHGRMPKGGALPFAWYDTPNIHLFTRQDFVDLCREDGIKILDMVCIPKSGLDRLFVRAGRCNLGADRVLAKIARGVTASDVPCRLHASDGGE